MKILNTVYQGESGLTGSIGTPGSSRERHFVCVSPGSSPDSPRQSRSTPIDGMKLSNVETRTKLITYLKSNRKWSIADMGDHHILLAAAPEISTDVLIICAEISGRTAFGSRALSINT